jgi:ATP-dependent DNA helicase RecG
VTEAELQQALTGESPRVEWKESDKDAGMILRAVCALANDLGNSGQPGYLVLGIRDDGHLCGLGYPEMVARDQAQQALASRLGTIKLLPNPSVAIHPFVRDSAWIMVVRVEPYPVPPVVKVDQVAWVRVGTVTRRATDADLLRLEERRPEHGKPFDLRVVPGAMLDELDLRRLAALHAVARDAAGDPEAFPELEWWLGQRELASFREGRWQPNATALLLFGTSPQSHVPGAYVEMVGYHGDDYDSPVAWRHTVSGTVIDQLEDIWKDIQARVVDAPVLDEGMRTSYGPLYPLEALRELARNMLQHRLYEGTRAPSRISWFSDRVVFNNPGGPFGRASEGELGSHSDYRNPTLTRELAAQGYVERLGRGLLLARRNLERNGNPPLEVSTDGFTTITVRPRAPRAILASDPHGKPRV